MRSATATEALRAARRPVIDDVALRGRSACHALSAVTDGWLAAHYREAAGDRPGVALVAVGGYGRGELAPGSDLDLWLVHDGRSDVSELSEHLWYPVWDAGLKLGHGVRTPKQALTLAADDLDTATSILSLRLLAGDHRVVEGLADKGLERWRKRSGRWLPELARVVKERHAAYDEVAFLLEPNVKEGRGGLRDVHAMAWTQAARPVLQPGDQASLAEAEETLLAVRVALHRLGGRSSDDLLLERQDEVAAALGDRHADALMGRLAEAARTVAWVSDEVWARVGSAPRPLERALRRRDQTLGSGLVLRDNEVQVTPEADVAGDVTLVLRAGAAAAEHDARIDRPSLERLGAEAPTLEGHWPDEARQALVSLLAVGRPAIAVLEALDQRRLLERVLPEWAPTRSCPQRNALHRFTVDRHLCETAVNAAALTGSVARPDLLLIGAWLHDIGKGRPGDHTELGVGLMGTLAPRMGFHPADAAVLVGMVRHHLLLPDVATRRDLGDDDVIIGVATEVGSLLLLELLAALTEADSRATAPGIWTPWKAELMGVLVNRVAHVLRGGEASDVTGPGFPGPEVATMLAQRSTVVDGADRRLLVVAPDRPGVFSRVAGTLALRGVTVLGADAYSTDGMAASEFRVDPGAKVDWPRVTADVARALDGRLAIEARLANQGRASRRNPAFSLAAAPKVRIDNAASGSATVVEVRAPDAIGVLYRITRALAELDLDIRLAKVATLGGEVLDTFYVRTTAGAKVVDTDHQRELERAILHHLHQ